MSTQSELKDKRPEFLIEVYKQMMADINRHIIVVWQSIGVVVGSFATLSLVEKKVLSLDFAASLFVLICSWSLALLIDSSYWYNRNLCIIANIERLFLDNADLRHVHYYFGEHRPKNKMITTLKIQAVLAGGIGVLVVVYHFLFRVMPGFELPIVNLSFVCALPYIVILIACILIVRLKKRRDKDYAEFLQNSPGVVISTEGIKYGGGHGFDGGGG